MTSLGNIEVTHLASLTFVSFSTGAILYLTGDADNHVGPDAQKIMPRQNALTSIFVTGYALVNQALPFRQRLYSNVERSPYSPPVRLLASEQLRKGHTSSDASAILTRIQIHHPTIATFTWKPSQKLAIKPGQAVVMDFTSLIGQVPYQHMAASNPVSVNDDRIRTWTVSGVRDESEASHSDEFSVTLRAKQGGAVTGAMFTIARRLQELKPDILEDTSDLELRANLLGVSGEFTLPETQKKMLWIAGGIGFTPFLRMFSAITSTGDQPLDIAFVLSTREPEVLLSLVRDALRRRSSQHKIAGGHRLSINVFTQDKADVGDLRADGWDITVKMHSQRLSVPWLRGIAQALYDREAYVCGPPEFESVVKEGLHTGGMTFVRSENFGY